MAYFQFKKECAMDYTVISIVVIFLLIIVLILQIQLSDLSKKIEEKEEGISKKIDDLLKEKKEPKVS